MNTAEQKTVIATTRMTQEEFAAAGLVVGVDAEGTSTCYDDGRMDVLIYSTEGMRKANLLDHITVCLIGDDRESTYPVTYLGTADFPRWEREDGSGMVGECPVALVQEQDHEHLIAQHPDYGWCSVGTEACRDFNPALDQ